MIYIFSNPINAFSSMRKRGNDFYAVNQVKLSNSFDISLSDENLLKLMIQQFKAWTESCHDNIFIINTKDIFKESTMGLLLVFLKEQLSIFPEEIIRNEEVLLPANLIEQYGAEIERTGLK